MREKDQKRELIGIGYHHGVMDVSLRIMCKKAKNPKIKQFYEDLAIEICNEMKSLTLQHGTTKARDIYCERTMVLANVGDKSE